MVFDRPSGQGSNAKIIKFEPYSVEGSYNLYILSNRMTGLLLQMTEYMRWKKRWNTIPEELAADDSRDSYISDLQLRLMQTVEFCEEVIACLDTDTDVKNSVRKVTNNYNFAGTNPGFPMTEEELTEDISNAVENNPTCDKDILWAQCLALVQTTNRFIVDVFEKIEAATNAVELADVASDIPFVSEAKSLAGINFVLELIQYWQNSIAEGYNAGYTLEYEQQLACELFCACESDCMITVERIYGILAGRVQDELTIGSIDDIISLLETIFGVTLNGTIVVDIAFFAAWGMVKYAQYLFGSHFEGITLQLVLDLAINDANDDWLLLCATCPTDYCDPMTTELGAQTVEISVTNPYGLFDLTNAGQWIDHDGVDGIDDGCIEGEEISYAPNFYAAGAAVIFSSPITFNGASLFYKNIFSGGGGQQTVSLFDDTGTLIENVPPQFGVDTEWTQQDHVPGEPVPGVKYVSFNINNDGNNCYLDNICINYTP